MGDIQHGKIGDMRQALATLSILFGLVFLAALYGFSHIEQTPQGNQGISSDTLPVEPHTMLTLMSPAFEEGGIIPRDYTCDGPNTHPALTIGGVPEHAQSLVLVMDDPDIPQFVKERMGIDVFDHWVLFNIPPKTTDIAAGVVPQGAREGVHSGGRVGYTGPCPPDREHRYFWKLFALDTVLELNEGATKADVERVMDGHIIASTTMLSRYERRP